MFPRTGATAAAYPDATSRSLDEIHLWTANAVFGTRLTALVAYDGLLVAAADAAGLPTASPGR